ncbi:hypothetical protein SAMN04488542_107118 [Fontibacillus panacisegetis]|uniref:GyrI-like small molecule binding domain-containing protein n=1 Tax=Fontibacillus panacisegetis TaxID=670482 RepID=A0A1G7JDD5_9BACL|nr:GyrI-like domain-containing protein [Fontibacillus panacisegetis]SDF22941.1 hypothetical protein SAMN04488542_107118 [Fontibacillus panacisegetis]
MNAIDLKKVYKDVFSAKENVVSVIDVPKFSYLVVNGEGHPSGTMFKDAVEALYNVAYTVKMMPKIKDAPVPEGYFDFVVPPLQCQSWLTDTAKKFAWKLFILQPDFVDEGLIRTAISIVEKKGKHLPLLHSLYLATLHEGKSIQCLHIGPFNSVKSTYVKIEDYMKEHGLTENGLWNEIYLSDKRKTSPEKLRTIIRCPVV